MKVSFESSDKVNGLMTIVVEEVDYKAEVEKTLKEYRKRANVPGFRPGNVPMSLIKRQYGEAVKMDEINKKVGQALYDYVRENNIAMLGEPLASEKQEPQDLSKEAPYTFCFDIAVAPEFKAELTGEDEIDYYEIEIDDNIIDEHVNQLAQGAGEYKNADVYTDGDIIKADLRELDENGNTLEGGVTVEGASIMPKYIKVDDQKSLFDGVKNGDIITFNPRKAYPDNDSELSGLLKIEKGDVANHTGDFSCQLTSISHFEPAAVDQKLFDNVFGKDEVKSLEEFRTRVAEGVKHQFEIESDYSFLANVRKYVENKIGEVAYPDALLKRIMLSKNKDKGAEYVDKYYAESIKELTWSLAKNQLMKVNNLKVEDDDVKEAAKASARMQFMQYGMNNIPEEYVERYADDLLKKEENVDRFVGQAAETKLMVALKNVVKLNKKTVSFDEFKKITAGE